MEILALGDSALVVRLEESSLAHLPELLMQLRAARIPGVQEYAPGYASIGVFLNLDAALAAGAPLDSVNEWLRERITAALAQSTADASPRIRREPVIVPVCYEAEFALDLGDIAHHAKLSADEVVQLHAGAEYIVRCVGFAPGFPYLAGLPSALTTARRAVPRTRVPAGSVAIGGSQAGIYPNESPGGWNIIGRTPLRVFEVTRESPSLLRAGDRVRFRTIERAEFDRLAS